MNAILLSLLMQASQPQQVQGLVGKFEALRESRIGCKFQLKDKIIPTECYRTLALEKSLQLVTPIEERKLRGQLDTFCKKFAKAAAYENAREIPRPSGHLSSSCRANFRELNAILAYRQGDRSWSGF